MLKNRKDIEIAMLYIGCVIGAGFASGQETLQFFSKYGKISNLSVCIMGFLFAFIAFLILKICDYKNVNQYIDFQNLIGGKLLTKIFSISATTFMFICLATMFAGCGALIEEGFGIKAIFSTTIFAILCYAVLIKGACGIIKINTILTILLISGSIIICAYIAFFNKSLTETLRSSSASSINSFAKINIGNMRSSGIYKLLENIRDNWVVALLLYVSYNLITSKILLVTNSYEVRSKKSRMTIAIWAGVVFTIIGLLQNSIILQRIEMLEGVQIPILAIVMSLNSKVQYVYIITILLAMFTTAISTGWGLLIRHNKNKKIKAFILIIAAIGFAQIGFSDLVAKIYPLFGYVGLLEIILIVIYSWRSVRKND
jgi:uncharacterized membrane protein YkvI